MQIDDGIVVDAFLQTSLPGHWAAPFRRLGQAMLYRWYYLRDEIL